MLSDFHFLVPENFHTNVVHFGNVVSEKIQFEFSYVHDLFIMYSHILHIFYQFSDHWLQVSEISTV